jgi:glyoxylase-like metal-dependent hydrolase (beta-lactamase superfamily II)/rhodanese-related sulfurtransferase
MIRQLFDPVSSTYTYLLADGQTSDAVLIDCVYERHARDAALIRELGLKLRYTLDTHCHADHVTGAWLMRKECGSKIGLSPAYGAQNIDQPLVPGSVVRFGAETLEVRATPGHTNSCLSFVSGDRKMVFTGDTLLVRGAGRTDFQEGSPHKLFRSIHEQLFTLPEDCIVYPAHDYDGRMSSTIGEERLYNPRIGGGAREEDFVGYMNNLNLPHPKQIAVAVPGNLRAGQPEDGQTPPRPDWGPVVTTYAGLAEISPEWVARHLQELQVLDVRDAAELSGEFGHLESALSIPLDELRAHVAAVSLDKPVVVVCQTGKRSGLGAAILTKAGFTRVASLAGGMMRWRELGLPS